MARGDNLTDLLKAVADSIRSKTGTAEPINPQDFPERIQAIQSAGQDADGRHRVIFLDIDGTVLKEQYVENGGAATAPPDPSREMCVFTGWMDAYNSITADTEIYAGYRSADGKTRYKVNCPAGETLRLQLMCMSESPVTIDWGDGVTDICSVKGRYALYTHTYAEAFSGWVSIYSAGGYRLTTPEYSGSSYVEELIIGDNIATISSVARFMTNCRAIVIPGTVKATEGHPFYKCVKLKLLALPDSITALNMNGSQVLPSLEHLRLPKGIKTVNSGVAAYLCKIGRVVIPDGVTEISQNSFSGDTSLEEVNLPDGVHTIKGSAFYNCSRLERIVLPSSIRSILYSAFNGCASLEEITVPSGVTSIEEGVFSGCMSLRSVNIPDGVVNIKKDAFRNCISLRSISIPDSAAVIGITAFSGCNNCRFDVNFTGKTILDGAFCNCVGLTGDIVLDQADKMVWGTFQSTSITSARVAATSLVGDSASSVFQHCRRLRRVELPAATTVGKYVMNDCAALEAVVLGDAIATIDIFAMANCASLRTIVVQAAIPPALAANALYNSSAVEAIYVPDTSVEAYRTATNWTAYASLIRPLSDYVED